MIFYQLNYRNCKIPKLYKCFIYMYTIEIAKFYDTATMTLRNKLMAWVMAYWVKPLSPEPM